MVKHNNVRPNNHMGRKDYQRYIKTHFDQPTKKRHRAKMRKLSAARKAPRPLRKLQPIVRCPTIKYNMRQRLGRGFSREELKKAGLRPKYARTIGIKVDLRRRNKSLDALNLNVRRLKQYISALVLFPLKPQGKDSKNKEKMIQYLLEEKKAKMRMAGHLNYLKTPLPFRHEKKTTKLVKLAEVPDYQAWGTMKREWLEGKNHFKWRRQMVRARTIKRAEAARKAKKAAKGK